MGKNWQRSGGKGEKYAMLISRMMRMMSQGIHEMSDYYVSLLYYEFEVFACPAEPHNCIIWFDNIIITTDTPVNLQISPSGNLDRSQ